MQAPPYAHSFAVPTYCIQRFPNHCTFVPRKRLQSPVMERPEKVFVIWETINLQPHPAFRAQWRILSRALM